MHRTFYILISLLILTAPFAAQGADEFGPRFGNQAPGALEEFPTPEGFAGIEPAAGASEDTEDVATTTTAAPDEEGSPAPKSEGSEAAGAAPSPDATIPGVPPAK